MHDKAFFAAAPLILAVEEEAPVGPSNVGLGSVVLTLALAALLGWVGYIVINARRRARRQEETPLNLRPGVPDEVLESTRLNRVLTSAVVSAAVLAVVLPVYYVNESGRQAGAAEKFAEKDIEAGSEWFTEFACVNCHGPTAGGGAAPFLERRSGINTSWLAPALDDVFFRFTEDEVRTVITYGRDGTPMAPAGLEGGGSMTVQEIDQVLAFLHNLQLSQDEALLRIDNAVQIALDRIVNGEDVVDLLLAQQLAQRDDVNDAPDKFATIEGFPAEIRALFADDGTCTDRSATLVGQSCIGAGADTDRDGLADAAERRLTEIAMVVHETVVTRQVSATTNDDGDQELEVNLVAVDDYGVTFRTDDGFTNETTDAIPIADLEAAETFLTELDTSRLTLSVTTDRHDVFLGGVESRIEFLEDAKAIAAWEVDYDDVLTAMEGTDVAVHDEEGNESTLTTEDARRAFGLFNAYCARCHTAGYSAGVAFQQAPGSGAWGPSLEDGRALLQFPDPATHITFVTGGSEFGKNYGINGLGTGRMPGFGQVLTQRDIELIVAFERSL
ncbi:MAG TPA: c-type cytochrome [Acidimicrobiia bacterium]|jgi:mono/diheme cytochrome c family protein